MQFSKTKVLPSSTREYGLTLHLVKLSESASRHLVQALLLTVKFKGCDQNSSPTQNAREIGDITGELAQ